MRGAVPVDGSIRDAMQAIDRSGAEIALAVDPEGRFVGTLTDGDIRRALLTTAGLGSSLAPYVVRAPVTVSSSASRAEVLDLMQARRISQVPVVDAGKLVGLHLLHEVIGAKVRPNWAVVMAGGIGSRLRPLTDSVPKPMLKVAGRPILERIVLHLVGHGIRRIYISVNYLAAQIEDHFGDGSRFGCRIEYLREDRPLGTGGALSLLPPASHPVLVMNGDLVTQADVGSMLDAHAGQITVGVRPYIHTVPFGVIETDSGKVFRIEEKPQIIKLVNAGIYVFSPETLLTIPYAEYPITRLIDETVAVGRSVGTFEVQDDWLDVGQHDQLRLARGAA